MKLISICFIIIAHFYSQSHFIRFDRISLNEGLSVLTVNDIIQGDEGFLWIATTDGLNKYDGYSIRTFRKNDGLTHNTVLALEKDSDQFIWIGTKHGISQFNPKTTDFISTKSVEIDGNKVQFTHITHIKYDRLNHALWFISDGTLFYYSLTRKTYEQVRISSRVESLFLDENQMVWAGLENGFGHVNSQLEFKLVRSFTEAIIGINEDISGDLWLVSSSEIRLYNKRTSSVYSKLTHPDFFKSFPTQLSGEIRSDSQHRLWLGTQNKGVFGYNYQTHSFTQYKHQIWNTNSLSHNYVTDIFEDKDGLFWIGTKGGGVNKIRYYETPHFTHIEHHPDEEYTLFSNSVNAILNTGNATWYAQGSDGIDYVNDGKYKHYYGLGNVASLEYHQGKVFAGSDNGLYLLEDGQFKQSYLKTKDITFLKSDEHSLWIGTTEGLFELKNGRMFSRGLQSQVINTVLKTDNGLWVGTENGLLEYNELFQVRRRYFREEENLSSLSDNEINVLYLDDKRRIWVGTSAGLNVVEGDSVQRISTVSAENIHGILQDKNSNLWMSSNHGLIRYHFEKDSRVNYYKSDGLQGNQFHRNSFTKSNDGRMYFGGMNGVTVFYPDQIFFNSNTPEVVFTDIQVNYRSVLSELHSSKSSEMVLSYNENSIEFTVSALDYLIPEKNNYQYMLEGFDTDWVDGGTRRTITYTNLDAGLYTFRVRASNNDGVWSLKEKALSLRIVPPIWETLWFRVSFLAFIVFSVVRFYKVRTNRLKRAQEHLEEEVEKRTHELIVKHHEIEEANTSLEKENSKRRETEAQLLQAVQETDAIFENVREGIFLLGNDFIISEQHSKELERMFHKQTLGKRNFLDLMKPLVTEKIYDAIMNFVNLLYNEDVDEDVVLELNPIETVEAHFEKDTGDYETHTFKFNFKRIITHGEISNLLVTVKDITENLILQKQLKEKEEKNKTEIEQLLSILKVDASLLNNFLFKSDNLFKEMKQRFKNDNEDYTQLLKEMYREIHNLKGNANLLEISFLVDRFHRLEDTVRAKLDIPESQLRGNDFLPILFEIGEIQQMIDNMKSMLKRVISISKTFLLKPDEQDDLGLLFKNIDNKVNTLSRELGKKALFKISEKSARSIPPMYKDSVKDILLQLVHNSIVHGVETVPERKKSNKGDQAKIELEMREEKNAFKINLRDDGRGLNISKLKELAVQRGKYTQQEVETLPNRKLIPLIFEDGLSTKSDVTEVAGRGEGMSLVKQIVSRHKGKIKVSYKSGMYFEVGIEMPLN